jgi:polysaccharide biosynthesis/export protein
LIQNDTGPSNTRLHTRTPLTILAAAGFAAAAISMTGCTETDAWLMDPSVIGRWEQTPGTAPILSRIASVEGPEDEFLEITSVQAGDLIPEVEEYRVGPGDGVQITLYDFPNIDRQTELQVVVDPRGYVNLPQLGYIYVNGQTVQGAQRAIEEAMEEFIANPQVFVQMISPRQHQYYVLGGVAAPSAYYIPASDYRLLQALSAAGGFSEAPRYIYIIRQLPLADAATARPIPAAPRTRDDPGMETPAGPNLMDLIEEYSQPGTPPPSTPPREIPPETPPPDAPPGSPAMFQPQPEQPPAAPIDLLDPQRPATPEPQAMPDTGDMTWVYLNGRWVRVRRAGMPGEVAGIPTPDMPGGPIPGSPELVTQRVIRIPVGPLKTGDARFNIIVRPGDIIRVPPPPAGTVYLGGQVNRPGAFGLAEDITLMRVIAAAGGLSALAIPERTDIVRMVGGDRQGFIRVNLRAVAEGTQPDLFLKANDYINVGTNFWALPMAVIRNGFRATYGFGFLLDRNFGNDVFGAPPAERIRGF